MTKIIIALFISVLTLHVTAALLTYATVSSGRYVESNPTAAMLQINYGLATGLTLTLVQGTLLSAVPLAIYLGTLKFARSDYVPLPDRAFATRFVKLLFFPLALFVLAYLAAIACVDVTHDLAMFLSNGQLNLWSF
jgi:hypothetical protein